MRSSRVLVRASVSQCEHCNSSLFDHSVLQHPVFSILCGDESVLIKKIGGRLHWSLPATYSKRGWSASVH
jgi:hypothetical protein